MPTIKLTHLSGRLTRRPVLARHWQVLLIVATGNFLGWLDATIVNLAFPSIDHTFHRSSLAEVSWVLDAETNHQPPTASDDHARADPRRRPARRHPARTGTRRPRGIRSDRRAGRAVPPGARRRRHRRPLEPRSRPRARHPGGDDHEPTAPSPPTNRAHPRPARHHPGGTRARQRGIPDPRVHAHITSTGANGWARVPPHPDGRRHNHNAAA